MAAYWEPPDLCLPMELVLSMHINLQQTDFTNQNSLWFNPAQKKSEKTHPSLIVRATLLS
jgi:hypothetical protein